MTSALRASSREDRLDIAAEADGGNVAAAAVGGGDALVGSYACSELPSMRDADKRRGTIDRLLAAPARVVDLRYRAAAQGDDKRRANPQSGNRGHFFVSLGASDFSER